MRSPLFALVVPALAAAVISAPASADPADFYRGKNVDLYVGSSPGGGYDGYARLLARHWGRLIPGQPSMVVRNMPGAGSLKATNYIYSVAPRDGSVVAGIQNGVVFEPLFRASGAGDDKMFDPMKLSWIGAVTRENEVMVVWHESPFKTIADLKGREVLSGASGAGTSYAVFPRLMNATMGTDIKVIQGYKGTSGIVLALESGEVHAMTGWDYSSLISRKAAWVRDGKVRILVQFGSTAHPDMPNVPLAKNLATSDMNREVLSLITARQNIGRPYIAPPDLPADRLKALRDSFQAMMKDDKFLADAEKGRVEINPSSGESALAVIQKAYAAPKEVVENARRVLKQ